MNLDLKYFLIYNIIANVIVLACSTHLSNLIHPRVNYVYLLQQINFYKY